VLREIGSEFWLDHNDAEVDCAPFRWLECFGHFALVASGRAAITRALELECITKGTVLLPAYTCEAVVQPFAEQGLMCRFYGVNENLEPDIDCIREVEDVSVFLHMGYFGFNSNKSLDSAIHSLKQSGAIIVEDVTHTLFSTHTRHNSNDYYVASLRKWFGAPSGGVIASSRKISATGKNANKELVEIRTDALSKKARYISSPDPELKREFNILFRQAEQLLNTDASASDIDEMSRDIVFRTDAGRLISKRRENYTYLYERLTGCKDITVLGHSLSQQSCPLCFPVLVHGARDWLQSELAKKGIYCPAHWPPPSNLTEDEFDSARVLYDCEMSIPCDQRYGLSEMEYIADIIETLLLVSIS